MKMIPSKALMKMESAAKWLREKARMQEDGLNPEQALGCAEMMVMVKKEIEALEGLQSILKKAALESPESFEAIKEVTIVKGARMYAPAKDSTSAVKALLEVLGEDAHKPGMLRFSSKAYHTIEARLTGPAGRRRFARITETVNIPTHVRVNAR